MCSSSGSYCSRTSKGNVFYIRFYLHGNSNYLRVNTFIQLNSPARTYTGRHTLTINSEQILRGTLQIDGNFTSTLPNAYYGDHATLQRQVLIFILHYNVIFYIRFYLYGNSNNPRVNTFIQLSSPARTYTGRHTLTINSEQMLSWPIMVITLQSWT